MRLTRDAAGWPELLVENVYGENDDRHAALEAEGYCPIVMPTDEWRDQLQTELIADFAAQLWLLPPHERFVAAVDLTSAGITMIRESVAMAEDIVRNLKKATVEPAVKLYIVPPVPGDESVE